MLLSYMAALWVHSPVYSSSPSAHGRASTHPPKGTSGVYTEDYERQKKAQAAHRDIMYAKNWHATSASIPSSDSLLQCGRNQ